MGSSTLDGLYYGKERRRAAVTLFFLFSVEGSSIRSTLRDMTEIKS